MAFSQTSLSYCQPQRRFIDDEIVWLQGDPGVTYHKDAACAMSGGVLIAATDSLDAKFFPVRDVVCSAATGNAFTNPKDLFPGNPTTDTTWIPCRVLTSGSPSVRTVKLYGYADETVVTYSAGSKYIQCTTGFGADDRPNGSIVYVYEGPGQGEVNVVEDYDHAGGATNLLLELHRPFKATLTTASKFIVLGSTAAANAASFWGLGDLYDVDQVDVIDGADDGNYIFAYSARTCVEYLKHGWAPILPAAGIFGL